MSCIFSINGEFMGIFSSCCSSANAEDKKDADLTTYAGNNQAFNEGAGALHPATGDFQSSNTMSSPVGAGDLRVGSLVAVPGFLVLDFGESTNGGVTLGSVSEGENPSVACDLTSFGSSAEEGSSSPATQLSSAVGSLVVVPGFLVLDFGESTNGGVTLGSVSEGKNPSVACDLTSSGYSADGTSCTPSTDLSTVTDSIHSSVQGCMRGGGFPPDIGSRCVTDVMITEKVRYEKALKR